MADATIVGAVLAGAASFLSPCVLPLLPGYLSLMSGYSVAQLSEGDVSMLRVTRAALLFIAGFTAVFVFLVGSAAGALGRWLNQPEIARAAGYVVIAMGLFVAVTAVWTPSFLMPLMRDRRVEVRPSRLGALAPPVMGAAFAFGWTPCIGPFLTAIFTLAATSDTAGRGMVLLFFYSLGLGIPFLLSSLLLARAFSAFGFIKRFLTPITIASGALLALFGVLLVTDQIVQLNSFFSKVLIKLGLEGLASV
jgi:cytochrome c-type biogenesis protein